MTSFILEIPGKSDEETNFPDILLHFICCKPACMVCLLQAGCEYYEQLTVSDHACIQHVCSCIYSIQSTHNLRWLFAASQLWMLRAISPYPQPACRKQQFLCCRLFSAMQIMSSIPFSARMAEFSDMVLGFPCQCGKISTFIPVPVPFCLLYV